MLTGIAANFDILLRHYQPVSAAPFMTKMHFGVE